MSDKRSIAGEALEVAQQIKRERDELRAQVERLRVALDKHHDQLSDDPDGLCPTCGLDALATAPVRLVSDA